MCLGLPLSSDRGLSAWIFEVVIARGASCKCFAALLAQPLKPEIERFIPHHIPPKIILMAASIC